MIKPSRPSQRIGILTIILLTSALLLAAPLQSAPTQVGRGSDLPSTQTASSIDTIITGPYVSGVWTPGIYHIAGPITVHNDSSLTIEPSVEVILEGYYQFIVEGLIHAVGNDSARIRFTAADSATGWGGLRLIYPHVDSRLEYCHFSLGNAQGNWPDNRGGAIYLQGSMKSIKRCVFIDNRAYSDGGAVYMWGATPEFSYNLFTGNLSENGYGHAIYMGSSLTPVLNHLTIEGNKPSVVTGDIGYSLYVAMGSFLKMQNSIVWDSSYFDYNEGDVKYNDIQYYDSETLGAMGEMNVGRDPKFKEPEDGDYLLLHLYSPCIDAALPTSPYFNEPQPNGNRANLGAYANNPKAAKSVPLFSFYSDTLIVDLPPDVTDFGTLKINPPDTIIYTDTLQLPFYNLGRQIDTIWSVDISDSQFMSNFDILVDSATQAILLYPDSSTTLSLAFIPRELGPVEATLSFNHTDTTAAQVTLSGRGVNPIIALSDSSFDFGALAVGEDSSQNLWVYNQGVDTLHIASVDIIANFSIVDSAGNRVFNDYIAPGDTILYTARFSPLDQGDLLDSIRIVNNAGNVYVRMSGQGSQPILRQEAEKDSLEYGVVPLNTSKTDSFYVTNLGEIDLVLGEYTLTDPVNFSLAFDPNQMRVPNGDTLYIPVIFTPTRTGPFDEDLTIETNIYAPDTVRIEVSLFGTGTNQTAWQIGEVGGTWVNSESMDTTYYVVGDIILPEESTLTIEPGVKIKLEGNFEFSVYGTLLAMGDEANPIEFTTIGEGDNWVGITFGAGSDSSILRYCHLYRGAGLPEDTIKYGGVLRIEETGPNIEFCQFYDNTATRGGALALLGYSNATINGCDFYDNTANRGGAIYADWYASSEISNCSMYSNQATLTSGTSTKDGGAIYLSGAAGKVHHCEIYDNSATNMGGGLYLSDGSITELCENNIYNNSAANGGGMVIRWFSKPFIHDERIYWNTASGNGGGLFTQDECTPVIRKTLIVENEATLGQALYTLGSGSIINYCTLAGDTSSADGWLLAAAAGDETIISNSILGSIQWPQEVSGSAILDNEAYLSITYSDVLLPGGEIYTGMNNTNLNPAFVGGDPITVRYSLTDTSAALHLSDTGEEIGFNGGSSLLTWTITLVLLQNPAQPNSMIFALTSSIPLMSPPYMYLEQDRPDTVEYAPVDSAFMVQIAPMVYNLPLYLEGLNYPTMATFSLTNISGQDTTLVQNYTASELRSNGTTISIGGLITATARSASGTGVWGLLPEYYSELKPLNPELLAIGQAYQVFAAGADLTEGCIELILSDETLNGHSAEGCAIALWNEDAWEILPSYLTGDKSTVWASIDQTGTYRLVWGEHLRPVILPTEVTLRQNYPNPFNPETVIEFALPEADRVKLDVYNVMGSRVITLLDGPSGPGYHRVRWSGLNHNGLPAASGIYFYRLQVGKSILTKKMILLR